MPGPLPKAAGQRRRRNAPTIPTTKLPAGGREGQPPKCPYQLGRAGRAWWTWAWHTPQAAAWSDGDLFALARRARLEDDSEMGVSARMREMRELDDRFGLTAKGMAALRWEIAADEVGARRRSGASTPRMRVVDPELAATAD